MIGYRKVKKTGKWAVCGPTDEVVVGVVTVTKKSGETEDREVLELGKPFTTDDGEELVYGYLEEREQATPQSKPQAKSNKPTKPAPVDDDSPF